MNPIVGTGTQFSSGSLNWYDKAHSPPTTTSRSNKFLDFCPEKSILPTKDYHFHIFFDSDPKIFGALCAPNIHVCYPFGTRPFRREAWPPLGATPLLKRQTCGEECNFLQSRAPGRQNFLTSAPTMVGLRSGYSHRKCKSAN